MTQHLTVDGRTLKPISAATYQFVRGHLPRVPLEPGVFWLADTCWIATYSDEAMQPEHFAGWECLNEVEGWTEPRYEVRPDAREEAP